MQVKKPTVCCIPQKHKTLHRQKPLKLLSCLPARQHSRLMPGKSDCITAKDPVDNTSHTLQTRHMTMTVNEAYQLYIKWNTDCREIKFCIPQATSCSVGFKSTIQCGWGYGFYKSVVLQSEEYTGAIAQANITEVSSMPVQHDVAPHASTSTASSASVLNCGSYQAGIITMAIKQKGKKATSSPAVYPCGSCQVNYGDPSDPKIAEGWIWCKKVCKSWFHQTCAEDCGVFDDADGFTSLKCLWLYVSLMWTWYRNAVDAGEIHILTSTVSTLYVAFLNIKGVMIKWWFWSHVWYE